MILSKPQLLLSFYYVSLWLSLSISICYFNLDFSNFQLNKSLQIYVQNRAQILGSTFFFFLVSSWMLFLIKHNAQRNRVFEKWLRHMSRVRYIWLTKEKGEPRVEFMLQVWKRKMQRQLRNESKYIPILVSDGSYSQRIYSATTHH